jgi:hypothetical protein
MARLTSAIFAYLNDLPDGSKPNRVICHVFIRMGKKYGKVSGSRREVVQLS